MLRKAAKPDPPRRAEDVRLWLGVHDLSRIEWTTAVQMPGQAERRYDVQLAVEIPATIFPSHSVWEHLQIFTRLQSPAEEGPLEIEREDLEELRRDTLGVTHRIKRLGQRFERTCVAAAAQLREAPDPQLDNTLTELVTQAVDLLAEMRRALAIEGEVRQDVRRECALSDEFLSHALIDFFAGCERAIDETLFGDMSTVKESASPWAEDLRCLVAEGLSEELVHRRGKGYITPRADGHAELAAFLERASRLKKHFQDVLYLDVEAYFVDSRMRNYTGVAAAGLAALMWLSFTLLPIGTSTRAGLGVGTFAVAFALAYAIKDRIKELTRGWITGRLMRLYGQRMVTLKLPKRIDPAHSVLLETRETFDVDSEPNAADDLREVNAAINAIGAPKRVVQLKFRMRATLHRAPALERAHIYSVKHIFRYDLSPIFARLDNAVKQVPVLDDNRRVRFADAPREYRFPARIVFTPVDGDAIEHTAYIVASKRGIERIEPRAP